MIRSEEGEGGKKQPCVIPGVQSMNSVWRDGETVN